MFHRMRFTTYPCGPEASTGYVVDAHPSTTTFRLRPRRYNDISSKCCPRLRSAKLSKQAAMPHSRKLLRCGGQRRGRDGLKSRPSFQALDSRRSRSEVERPFLIPCCRVDMRWCSHRWRVSCSAMIYFRILLTTDRSERGSGWQGLSFRFLCTGVTCPSFHRLGQEPLRKH